MMGGSHVLYYFFRDWAIRMIIVERDKTKTLRSIIMKEKQRNGFNKFGGYAVPLGSGYEST
jgi:hypothetical protein